MHEQHETIHEVSDAEVTRQIALAEAMMSQSSGRTLGEVITTAMGRHASDPEKVAQSLVDQKIFESTADCPDPLAIAKAVVARYQEYGESLREKEKPI
jgi:hypothetical protein